MLVAAAFMGAEPAIAQAKMSAGVTLAREPRRLPDKTVTSAQRYRKPILPRPAQSSCRSAANATCFCAYSRLRVDRPLVTKRCRQGRAPPPSWTQTIRATQQRDFLVKDRYCGGALDARATAIF